MPPAVKIVQIPLQHIVSHPKEYNTNNHAFADLPAALQSLEHSQLPPATYRHRLYEVRFSHWRPVLTSLHQPPADTGSFPEDLTGQIPLSRRICAALKPAVEIGMQTGRIPEMYREDVEDLLLPLLAPYFPGRGERYFMRLDEASSKDGVGSMGPFQDARGVAISLLTSHRAFKTLRDPGEGEMIHFLPWRNDIGSDNEWRVFVPGDGRVRAVSQYSESLVWGDDEVEGYKRLREVVPRVLECNEMFRKRVEAEGKELPESGYVLDVHAALRDGEWVVEPVELNPFGAQMASGSGLFNWPADWRRMYGLEDEIEVRVVGP